MKILIITFIIIVSISVYFFIFYYKNQDIENVKVEGYVLDSYNSSPIEAVKVLIVNERYENDKGHKNYDEYLGHDKIELKTDNKVYYSTVLKKSAFIYVILEKKGYKTYEEEGKIAKKIIYFKTLIDKQ